ncbi:MAG: hypothetical protein Q4F41_14900 [Eubacteriales bacterium]|nr:hypothetical protein [Eubacteriales bacterium]
MNKQFQAFGKKLFGVRYERLARSVFVCLIIFFGLRSLDFSFPLAPPVLPLAVSVFTAGVLWQALSSEDNAANLQNLFMLPFSRRMFLFSYISAMGAYTLLTKTAPLFAILLALLHWSLSEIFVCILCSVNAILTTAVLFSQRTKWYAYVCWATAIILAAKNPWFLPIELVIMPLLLQTADNYVFYFTLEPRCPQKNTRRHSVRRYLFRYLLAHKNYLLNTVLLWTVAWVLPLFFRQLEGSFLLSIGFAMLSFNTPLSILLSCDPALERAVRFLPGQKKAFFLPYCLLLFAGSLIADTIFLCSWQIRFGGITWLPLLTAVLFALQSAILSVLLESFFPIRDWKIESDLWHHPRKYLVPLLLLLLAVLIGTKTESVLFLGVMLLCELCWFFLRR